jgi:protein tyrosine phosphatase (PTP) superfamily phosphohydrolase (DUF442 family)
MKTFFCRGIIMVLFFGNQSFAQTTNSLFNPQPLQANGIENFFQLSDRIYSGSSPDGEVAFAELQKRGIKTLISVDGAKPDVESAKKFGLRYVHLPFGYDGVPTNQAVKLVKAATEMPQPIYVHCHHGLHRGPAGAAVICAALENWTATQAMVWLKLAGTSTDYAGLYKSVANFRPPSADDLKKIPANFSENTEVSALVDAMVEIDLRFDNLKLIKEAGYQKSPSHPDLSPAHEALLLDELFKELLRSPAAEKRDKDFQNKIKEAEKATRDFHSALSGSSMMKDKADAAFQTVVNSCAACHKAHRN